MRAHVTAALLLALTGPLRAADLGIAVGPEAAPGPVRLTLPAGQAGGTFALFLRNAGAQLDGGALVAAVQDAAGQPVPAATLDLLPPGADKPPATWTVPAQGQVRIHLKVANLTKPGLYVGSIGWQKGQTFEPVAALTVERPAAPKLTVRQADATQVVRLTTAARAFSFPLTVTESTGEGDVSGLTLTLGPLTRKDGGSGTAATWALAGAPAQPLTVKKRDNLVLTLAGELPERTDYAGWLQLRYGDQLDTYAVQLARPVTPAVTVLEAVEGKVALVIAGPDFERTLTVQTADGQPEVTDLKVTLEPLRRQDGKAGRGATFGFNGTPPAALHPGAPVEVKLKGDKLEPGAYLSALRFHYQGQTQVQPLAVTRVGLSQNLALDDPGTVTAVAWLPSFLFAGVYLGGRADVPVVVRETGGQATTIYHPQLGPFKLVDKAGTFAAGGGDVQLVARDSSGTLTAVPVSPPAPPPTVPGGREAAYAFRISGLAAGSYRGTVIAAGPDSTAVTKEFTVTVRDFVLWPMLAVLGGVMASYSLYSWMRDGRYRSQRGTDVARAREDLLRNVLAPAPDPVRAALLDRLRHLAERNLYEAGVTTEAVAASIKDIDKRARVYRQGLDAQAAVGELLAHLPPEAQGRHDDFARLLTTAYDELRTAILSPEPQGLGADPQDAPAKVRALIALHAEVRAATVREPAKALAAQVAQLLKETPELADAAGDLPAVVNQIVAEPDNVDVDKLADRYRAALTRYARLSVTQLEGLIVGLRAGRKAAPGADWTKEEEHLQRATDRLAPATTAPDADAVLAACRAAGNEYQRALIEHLDVLTSPDGRPAGFDDQEWAAALAAAPGLRGRLAAARAAWVGGDFAGAGAIYRQVRDEYVAVLGAVLGHELARFGALMRERPWYVPTDADWDKVRTADPLKSVLAALDTLKAELAGAANAPATREQKYRDVRRRFLDEQLKGLGAAADRLRAYYDAHKNEPAHESDPKWTNTFPDGLTTLDAALADAGPQVAAAVASTRDDVILAAREAVLAVETSYRTLMGELRKQKSMSGTPLARAMSGAGAGAAGGGLAAPVPAGAPPVPAAPSSPAPAPAVPPYADPVDRSVAEWNADTRRRETIAKWCVILAATLTGVSAVWLPAPAFGGWQDYATAVLWGFGMHSAANGFLAIATSTGLVPPEQH